MSRGMCFEAGIILQFWTSWPFSFLNPAPHFQFETFRNQSVKLSPGIWFLQIISQLFLCGIGYLLMLELNQVRMRWRAWYSCDITKHFQDLAIEKTGWSYMYTGRKQSDWSLWTWNGHNYFSVNKTREHTDTGPEPILQKSLTKSKWLETMSLRYNRRLNSKQMRKSSVGNLDLILLVMRNKMFAIFYSLRREEHYFPPHAANFPSCTKYWHLKSSLVE